MLCCFLPDRLSWDVLAVSNCDSSGDVQVSVTPSSVLGTVTLDEARTGDDLTTTQAHPTHITTYYQGQVISGHWWQERITLMALCLLFLYQSWLSLLPTICPSFVEVHEWQRMVELLLKMCMSIVWFDSTLTLNPQHWSLKKPREEEGSQDAAVPAHYTHFNRSGTDPGK